MASMDGDPYDLRGYHQDVMRTMSTNDDSGQGFAPGSFEFDDISSSDEEVAMPGQSFSPFRTLASRGLDRVAAHSRPRGHSLVGQSFGFSAEPSAETDTVGGFCPQATTHASNCTHGKKGEQKDGAAHGHAGGGCSAGRCAPGSDGLFGTGIRVHNSLGFDPTSDPALAANNAPDEDGLVELRTMEDGQLSWYMCGPTVYDHCHLGHARVYVTFDIIRGILEDYFGINTHMVMNITDVDDKIILRARHNYLVSKFLEEHQEFDGPLMLMMRHALDVFEKRAQAIPVTPPCTPPLKPQADKKSGKPAGEEEGNGTAAAAAAAAAAPPQPPGDVNAEGSSAAASAEAAGAGHSRPNRQASTLEASQSSAQDMREGWLGEANTIRRLLEDAEGAASEYAAVQARLEAAATHEEAEEAEEELDECAMDAAAAYERLTLYAPARAALGLVLDMQQGGAIQDNSIFRDLPRHFEASFLEDLDALHVRPVDVLTRVSEMIPEQLDFIKGIMDNGFAYKTCNGSVFFDSKAFAEAEAHTFPKLAEESIRAQLDVRKELQRQGEGALGPGCKECDKRHGEDFALWKAARAGEPSWDSPWGPGRPGWHIECSAMAGSMFGRCMDVHSGGEELKFPHHDCELAQSEAHFGCGRWVNYFLHTGMVWVRGLRSAKECNASNFVTIKEALRSHSGRQLRLLFLHAEWDKPVKYHPGRMHEMNKVERKFAHCFQAIRLAVKSASREEAQYWGDLDRGLNAGLKATQAKVHAALKHNFDTRTTMLALEELRRRTMAYLFTCAEQGRKPRALLLRKVGLYLTRLFAALGLTRQSDDFGFVDEAVTTTAVGNAVAASQRAAAGIDAEGGEDVQASTSSSGVVAALAARAQDAEEALRRERQRTEAIMAAFVAFRDDVRKSVLAPSSTTSSTASSTSSLPEKRREQGQGQGQVQVEPAADQQGQGGEAESPARATTTATTAPPLRTSILNLCDRMRDEVGVELGVRLEDGTGGDPTRWTFESPDVLRAEAEARRRPKRLAAVVAALGSHEAGLVKDRSYHMRTYKECFVGKDAVQFLVDRGFATDKDGAINLGQQLAAAGLVRHVTGEHGFKDAFLFYNITASNSGEVPSVELRDVARKIELSGLMGNRTYLLRTYKNCFIGKSAVKWMVETGIAGNPTEAVALGQQLVAAGLMRHVTGEHGFKDAFLFYNITGSPDDAGQQTPQELFRNDPRFSAWDGQGLPTHYVDGLPLKKRTRKKLMKVWQRQEKLHFRHLAKMSAASS